MILNLIPECVTPDNTDDRAVSEKIIKMKKAQLFLYMAVLPFF